MGEGTQASRSTSLLRLSAKALPSSRRNSSEVGEGGGTPLFASLPRSLWFSLRCSLSSNQTNLSLIWHLINGRAPGGLRFRTPPTPATCNITHAVVRVLLGERALTDQILKCLCLRCNNCTIPLAVLDPSCPRSQCPIVCMCAGGGGLLHTCVMGVRR